MVESLKGVRLLRGFRGAAPADAPEPPRTAQVLIAEDDVAVREVIRDVFEAAGYSVRCAADAPSCTLAGSRLFLIDSIASSDAFTDRVTAPQGFTGATIAVPRPKDGALYLKLRDDADAIAKVETAGG